MQDLKIALSMIVEEHEPVEIVQRAITSLEKFVDGIFVTITHKAEKPETSELITLLQSKNIHISYWKWTYRFDEARNFAASQISDDYYYYLWNDADDVWHNPEAIPQIAQEAYINNQSAVFFDYWYMVELDENGNVREILVQHKRERLIRNDGTFKWVGRLHETLIEQRQQNVIKVFRPEVIVVHLSNDERSMKNLDRNIKILEETVKEEQRKDPRTVMYLAKAYFDRAKLGDETQQKIDLDLAEVMFNEYLEGSGTPGVDYQGGSGWREERSTAYQYLADIFRSQGRINKAIIANLNAIQEAPEFPMYYLDMSLNYVVLKEWSKAETWLKIGKEIEIPNTTIILTPRDMKARALEIDYHIAMAKNELDRAAKAAQKIANLFPQNEDFAKRLKEVDNIRIVNQTAQSLIYVTKYLEATNQHDKIVPLIQSIPKELEQEQFVAQMRHRFLPARLWEKDEIAILCGPGFEKWSPKSVEKGIGGSEAAVIYNAKELAKLGYRVTVYGDPQDDSGEYEGVTYKQWHELNTKDTFNIMIIWRAVGFVDSAFQARQTYLWAHDVPNNADFTEDRIKKIDKIFVLSQYHKSLFRMYKDGQFIEIPDDKFFITRNGIQLFPEDTSIVRDQYRMMYTSSYDRGLAHLLVMWPEIKKEVPEANLHIFYGWNTYDAIAGENPERKAWKAQMTKMMQQEGITEHGRVSHEELAKQYMQTGIFSYTCDFQEISCQNAMSAQVYGAVPVTTNYSALVETVQYGKKVDVDITSKDGKSEYIKELVLALKDDKWQGGQRGEMIEWAKKTFDWQGVATSWKELFDKDQTNLVSLL